MSSVVSGLVQFGLVSCCLLLAFRPLAGQSSTANQRTSRRSTNAGVNPNGYGDPSQTVAPRTISGRVINAMTGTPVPRALVNFSARMVLTDAQGKFAFPEFTATSAYPIVTKPGYSSSLTPDSPRQFPIKDLDSPIELKLYPNALLTGLVTGPDGLPLSRIQVQLSRLSFDASGPRWYPSGFAQTDIHGDYRFDVPAGRYRVATSYNARSLERGEAVLSVHFPAATSSNTESFPLTAGEQREVDLRPRMGPSYPVTVIFDGNDSERSPRVSASSGTGPPFQLGTQRKGDIYTVLLPAGSFTLHATAGDREDSSTGEALVTVAAHGVNQVKMSMASAPVFPVELSVESVASTNGSQVSTTPIAQQFNLTAHLLSDAGEGFNQEARLFVHPDRTASFQLAPGRYRLGAYQSGVWHVKSANSGVTNLLTEELVVAQGSAGSPIRLIVSNASGSLKGLVTTAGVPATGWVYLIPEQPTLTAYAEVFVQADGHFYWSGPPGKYLLVPSLQMVREDFRNPAFLQKFTAGAHQVEITDGGDANVDLTLAAEGVAR